MAKRWLCTVRVAAAAALSVAGAAALAEGTPSCVGLEPGPTRTVARIVDGETVVLDDGTELRLIGALAPRAMDAGAEPGTWPSEGAARKALRGLVLGKSVELAFAGERLDRYGRLQAHAFLIEGEGRRWVQAHLIENGLARAYALPDHRACGQELLAAERVAREGRRGLWADAAYQIRPADRPSELLRYRTTFQVVEGKVTRAGEARGGTVYLNFGRSWRRAFAVSVRRSDRELLGEHAGNPKGLEGLTVRVRGWIGQRGNAPAIDLSAGGLIEVVSGGDGRPDQAR